MKRASRLLLSIGIPLAVGFVAGHLSYIPTARLLRSAARATGLSKPDRELNAKLLGRPVPAVPLRSAEGRTTDLASMVQAPAVVVFYSASCSYCKTLHAMLNSKRAAGELGALHLVLIGVDDKEEAENAADLNAGPDDWPRGFLPWGEENLSIRSQYGLFRVPAIWFVDPAGKVLSRMNGFSERSLDRQIRRLLRKAEKPPA